jgi:transposase
MKSPEQKSLTTEATGQSGSAGIKIRQEMAFVGKRQGPGMKGVELYARVRFAVQIEGVSQREAARRFGIDPRTVAKMLAFSVPPGYRRRRPPARPKLDPFTGIIDGILAADEGRPRKQRHTAKRIFERLRDEHGYSGGITIVRDYVRGRRLQQREVFVALQHDPGHAQVDFGEALAEIAAVERKIHFFAMDLPHSDACFVRAYPEETAEAFCDGQNAAFGFFGRVPRSILYDNTKLAVARILGDGVRQKTRVFSELQSHYLFADRFGRPGKGNDKGKVEGLVGWIRRNLLVPRATSVEALNEQLLGGCRRRLGRSFYFRQTDAVDTTEKMTAGRACHWLQLGRVDSEQVEGLGLDRRRRGDQRKTASVVERAGGKVVHQALEAVDWAAIRSNFAGALSQRRW